MQNSYSIRELAREFGITSRTLRFYEDKGLLSPQRRGATRVFSERDRIRLKLALRGKRLGFSLEECREIIDLYDISHVNGNYQLLRLCDKIREHRAELVTRLRDIEATLTAMDDVERDCLAQLMAADGGSPASGRQ